MAVASRVFGVGVDVAHVPRFRRTLARFGERFLRRAFHPEEVAELRARRPEDRAVFLASRWAVKEAAFKAFHGHRVPFPDLRVTKTASPDQLTHGALPEGTKDAPARALRLELSGETARLALELRLAVRRS
jgi:phosphopantetheine--protein transferase-like protein